MLPSLSPLADGPPLGVAFWPEVADALGGAPCAGWDASAGTDESGAARLPFYLLEDGRSRVQGLMTAMSIVRMILLSGAIITKTPTR